MIGAVPPISCFSITRLSATDNANSALAGFLARFNGTLPHLIMFIVFQQVIMNFLGGAGTLIFV